MKNAKIAAVLFIVVFLLCAAVVCSWLVEDRAGDPAPSAAPEVSSAPIVETPPPVSTPEPTPAPTPSPTPTPAPTPTPEPTPTPTPAYVESSLGSGSFVSNTGVPLNIRVDWSARTLSESQVEFTVSVSLDSYSLHIREVPYSLNISVGGQYVSLTAPAVDYDGNTQISTPFGSKSFVLDIPQGSSSNVTVAVEWHFGGTYKDTPLDVVECGGSVLLTR